jgi:GT2 family glycosyltransferase
MRHRIGLWRRRWVQWRTGTAPVPLPSPVEALQDAGEGAGAAPAPHFEPAAPGVRDYLFFGVIDWHFRHQRPQQLALAIAGHGRRVFYVSVNFVEDERPGLAMERLHPQLALYQIFLKVRGPLSVYSMLPDDAQLRQLQEGLRDLWRHADIASAVSVIQHPFWHPLGGFFPAARTVYDCMDHHAGFSNTAAEHTRREELLLAQSDLTVVTSDYLERVARPLARRVETIRNAGDYDHFHAAVALREAAAQAPARPRAIAHAPPRVIGYYGAIAEWFDEELVDALARRFADCELRLIGDDSASVGRALRQHPNVKMLGEKPYAELPRWLADFDVCLIPFRVNELTLATNPVKVYEYLSAGKPVVGTDLPELAQFGDLVYRASGADTFADLVQLALDETSAPGAGELREQRMAFARQQTWRHRTDDFIRAAEDASDEALTSVVVVAYNQWALTQRCLESLEACRDGAPMQLIVVDNASKDETPQRLQAWRDADPANRVAVLNAENLGFGGGVNAGMAQARGRWLVVLNNDTIASPGWMRGLRRHFERDPDLGLVCPVTNNIGNEAQVALAGSTPPEVFASARHYTLARAGRTLELSVAAFFCVMMPRAVWERTGALDERFFPGFFEDDDYCLRVRQNGWRIGCAEDVFVYHELSATFNAESQARRQAIFERSRALFEQKWGPWKPHVYRPESLPR